MQSTPRPFESAEPAQGPAAIGADEVDSIWRENRRWLAAVILAHMPRNADLDDLLQDVAMLIVRSIHTVNDRRAIRPWLRTVAVNAARSAGRKQRTRLRLFRPVDDGTEVLANHPDQSPTDERSDERGRRLVQAAQQLPEMYRETLILRCVRGMNQKRAAEILGLPETTIETRLVRARKMLREQLEREERRDERAAGAGTDVSQENNTDNDNAGKRS